MGAAIAVDVNNAVEVNAVAFRVLSDNLGDDVTRAFINQFSSGNVRTGTNTEQRPRVTASQIADILERARAKAKEGRGKGMGDYTKEKHKMPEPSLEEYTASIMRMQDIMDEVKREHPEFSIGELATEVMKRSAERSA
jgi:hypothetical protein